jgi:hypothetical protein
MTMSDSTSLMQQLQAATAGLLYQSESDNPVEPFLIEGSADLDPKAPKVAEKLGADLSKARVVTPRRFFAPVAKEEEWHNDQERAVVHRFQALRKLLESNLRDLTVLRGSGTKASVVVVGRTPDGDLAGVKTQVVET